MGTVNTCTKISRKAAVPVCRCVMYILSSPPKYFSAHFGRVDKKSEHAIKTILLDPMTSPAYLRRKLGSPSYTGGKTSQTTILSMNRAHAGLAVNQKAMVLILTCF